MLYILKMCNVLFHENMSDNYYSAITKNIKFIKIKLFYEILIIIFTAIYARIEHICDRGHRCP